MKESYPNHPRFAYILENKRLDDTCKYDIVTLTLRRMLPHDITDKKLAD